MKSLKSLFFTGLIAILPLLITINLLIWISRLISGYLNGNIVIIEMVKHLSHEDLQSELPVKIMVYIFAVLILTLLIILMGLAMKNVIGKAIANSIDKIISKIPVIKTIYTTILQIRELMFSSGTKAYQKVVLIEYPRKGSYSLGFLTNRNNKFFCDLLEKEELISIFVPTSPNPTSGMFIMVESSEVRELDIKVEDAIKLIVSGGAIIPKNMEK
ncbi:MAG: DUF502 domain-containing protein [Psychrilyobacter sp.]|nr:DUF502 domain-containing protein [Psychrilyobacter sp.]